MSRTQYDVVRRVVGVSQKVDYSTSSVQSTSFPGNTNVIRVVASTDCFIEIGSNPTAVANTSMILTSLRPEYFAISPGDLVAVLRFSLDGSLFITPLN